MKTIKIMIIVSLLAGCGNNIAWKHPTSNAAMFNSDSNECRSRATESTRISPQSRSNLNDQLMEASVANLSTSVNRILFYKSEYKKCMKAKGYYEDVEDGKKAPTQQPPSDEVQSNDICDSSTTASAVPVAELTANAEKGDVKSQYLLGLRYSKGDELPLDKLKAYMWLHLAAEQGCKQAVSPRYEIATNMTQGEIAEAKRLAANVMKMTK